MAELYVGTPNGVQKLGGEKQVSKINVEQVIFGNNVGNKSSQTILDGDKFDKLKNCKFIIIDTVIDKIGSVQCVVVKDNIYNDYQLIMQDSNGEPANVFNISFKWNDSGISASISTNKVYTFDGTSYGPVHFYILYFE